MFLSLWLSFCSSLPLLPHPTSPQVWFQNRRARVPKNSQRKPNEETDAQVSRSHQGGFCAPTCSSHQGVLPRSNSSVTLQTYAGHFSWDLEGISGQAVFSGHSGVLDTNVASPDLEPPARTLGKPNRDFHCSPSSGFSPADLSQLSASQHPFSQLEAGGSGAHLGDPRSFLTYGDCALQGSGQHPSSGEQQQWGPWQPPLAVEPGMAPQQPVSQYPGAWEQHSLPPQLSPQEHWQNPADPSPLQLRIKPAEVPAGHQEQLPPLPPGQDLGGRPQVTLVPTHCNFGSST